MVKKKNQILLKKAKLLLDPTTHPLRRLLLPIKGLRLRPPLSKSLMLMPTHQFLLKKNLLNKIIFVRTYVELVRTYVI